MLIKIWFGLVSLILFVSLTLLLSNFNFGLLHWLWLIILVVASSLTIAVYLKQPRKNSLEETYHEFIRQKDKRIQELENRSNLLFKTAMKKAEEKIKN